MTIQELGLGSFEQRGVPNQASLAQYTDYWDTYSQVYWPDVTGAAASTDDQQTYHHMAVMAAEVSTAIINQPTLLADGSHRLYGPVLAVWDQQFGNFNSATKVQDELLRAASIILQESGLRAGHRSDYRSRAAVITPGRSIGSVTRQYSPTSLNPNDQLLLAGQLIHKAAWVEADPDRQTVLFGQAQMAYQHIIRQGSGIPVTQASKYLQDIKLYQAQEKLRNSSHYNNQSRTDEALQAMHKVLHWSAQQLVASCVAYESAEIGDQGTIKGKILEQFGPLALWATLVKDYEQGVQTEDVGHFAIRHTFPHEDSSPLLPIPPRHKPSFDMVVQRFDDGAIVTTPVEFKFRKRGYGRYLPGIAVVQCLVEVTDIRASAEVLARKYRFGSRADWRQQFPATVTDFCEVMQEKSQMVA